MARKEVENGREVVEGLLMMQGRIRATQDAPALFIVMKADL